MSRESKALAKKRVAKILSILKKRFPGATTALNWSNPLELLVATILSAQCTDERVNIVTRDLFAKYKTAADYAGACQEVLAGEVRSTGFYNNKVRSIRGAAERIVADFAGQVPQTMDELLTLPGVARKTANVVLGIAFGRNDGVVVDTHVMRVSRRLGLTRHFDNQGDRIEKDLMQLVPRKDWTVFSSTMVLHGRHVCTARKPDCAGCPVSALCPSAFKV